jgi:glycosyltransferase involved in cell wall biosynthesis
MHKSEQNIIQIIHDLKIGGVEIAALSALNSLNNNNNSFNFYLCCLGEADPILLAGIPDQLQKYLIVLGNKHNPVNYIRIIRSIRNIKPKIIINSLWKSALVGTLYKIIFQGTILISFIHNTRFFHFFDSYFTRLSILKSDYIFCDSKASKDFISHYFPNKEVIVISFLKSVPGVCKIPTAIGNEMRIMYLGRITRSKNIPRSLQVINLLKSHGKTVAFDIYGPTSDENEKERITNLINKMGLGGSVTLKGPLAPDEIEQIEMQYDYLMHLSDIEGMGMVVAESMQLGLIPVVTATGEIKNYAKDMYNALVAEAPFDSHIEELAIKLIKIHSDKNLYKMLSINALDTFANKNTYPESFSTSLNKIINDM